MAANEIPRLLFQAEYSGSISGKISLGRTNRGKAARTRITLSGNDPDSVEIFERILARINLQA